MLIDPIAARQENSVRTGPRWVNLLIVAVGAGGLTLWLRSSDVSVEGIAATMLHPGWIALGLLSLLLPQLVHSVRYHLLIRRLTRIPFHFTLWLVLGGTYLNHFVVSHAGDFTQPMWLGRRTSLSYWQGLQIGLIRSFHSMTGFFLVIALCAGAWAGHSFGDELPLLAWLLVLFAVGVVIPLVYSIPFLSRAFPFHATHRSGIAAPWPGTPEHAPAVLSGWSHRIRRAVNRARSAIRELLDVSATIPPHQHIAFISLAWAEQVLDAVPYILFLSAAGAPFSAAPILTAATGLNLMEYCPTPPAMLGVQTWIATLSFASVQPTTGAFAVGILLHRTARSAMIAVIGAIPFAALSRSR